MTQFPSTKSDEKIIATDAVIIGAGSAGLFAAFELGVLGLRAHLVETLPFVGGQCAELYADKPIYDIPGIKQCTAGKLSQRLLEQTQPFQPGLHLQQTVTSLHRLRNSPLTDTGPNFELATTTGQLFHARCVIMACGLGAFVPRTLPLEGIAPLDERQIFHTVPDATRATRLAGKHVVINGDTDDALHTANQLASVVTPPASVTLVHRRDKFRAAEATIAQTQALRDAGKLCFVAGSFSGLVTDATGHLTALNMLSPTRQVLPPLPADAFFILLGRAPQTTPFAHWDLTWEQKQLAVNPATMQTNLEGVYAIGDIAAYPGKRRLLVCAFHEATIAAYAAASWLQGGADIPVNYTSSNASLHALMGNPAHSYDD